MAKMNRKLVLVGLVAAAALMFAATEVEATWWGCYPAVSYSYAVPSYTSCSTACYSPCYDSCGGWYLGYRPGPIRRLLFGPCRWYYAGGWGCGWSACCDPCGGATVDACCGATSTGAMSQQPTPAPAQQPVEAAKPAPTPAVAPEPPVAEPQPGGMPSPPPALTPPPTMETNPPATTTTLPTTMTSTAGTNGLLTIWVPAEAKVYVNGMETKSVGSRRRYVSRGLQPGLTYKYEIRAELVRDGRIAEETQTVYLTAGGSEGLAFGFNRQPVNDVAMGQ